MWLFLQYIIYSISYISYVTYVYVYDIQYMIYCMLYFRKNFLILVHNSIATINNHKFSDN